VNERGFTFSEVVIALAVLSILLLVVGRGVFHLSEKTLTNSFIHQLKSDISYAQARAMDQHEFVWVTFDVLNDRYSIYSPTFRIDRKLPNYAEITFSNLAHLKFNQYGNSSHSGTIHFTCFETKYKFVVLLGMGRFYVEQL